MDTDSGQDNYFRLVTFVVEGCPKPLIQLFLLKAKSDSRPGVAFTDLKTFLKFHEKAIKQIKKRKIIRQTQYDLLYPSIGVVDETTWDISLVTTLIQNLFTLSTIETGFIQDVRNIRNELYHISVNAEVSDEEFVDVRDTLEKTVKGIVGLCSKKIKDETDEYVKMLRNKPLTPATPLFLGKLKEWYTLDEDIADLKEGIKTANDKGAAGKKVAVKNKKMLKRTSDVSFSRPGVSEKRMKVVDNALDKMKDHFKRTCELPEKFVAHKDEIEDIKAQLQHHRVIVSGKDRSTNLSSALRAIKELDYDSDRCAQITSADDWYRVTYEDVDLVLCVDPFGTKIYNGKRAEDMAMIFDDVLEKTNADPPINVVIITSTYCLKRFRRTGDHELFSGEVGISTANADSEDECGKDNLKEIQDQILLNLLAHSRSLIHNYNNDDRTIHKLRQAHEMLMENNFVVISGPRYCGKTTMAMRLLLPDRRKYDRCLVLTDPSDWKHVSVGCINIVVIEDFCGKYGYDGDLALHWLRKFDLLQALVQQGEMKLIITTNDENLQECWKENLWHALLETSITLDNVGDNRMVKYIGPKEPIVAFQPISKNSRRRRKQTVDLNYSDRKMVSTPSSTATLERQFDPKLEKETKISVFQVSCCHGLIYIVDNENGKVKVFNVKGEYLSSASVSGPRSITDIGDDRVAVIGDKQIDLLRYFDRSLIIDETITIPYCSFYIAYYNRQFYIRSSNIGRSDDVHVLGLAGNMIETIEPYLKVKSSFYNHVINQQNGTIYIVDNDQRWKARYVIAMSRTGEKKNEKDFQEIDSIQMYGTAIDSQGRIYVCGTGRTNVLRMSEDLQSVTEIVTQIPENYRPQSISVSGNTLVLCCKQNNFLPHTYLVQVYKLK